MSGVQTESPTVAVIGATAEALATTTQLLAMGYAVCWVGCGDVARDLALRGDLGLYPSYTVTALHGAAGAFALDLAGPDGRESLSAAAVIVAVGNERCYVPAGGAPPLSERVLSASQAADRLAADAGYLLPYRYRTAALVLDLGQASGREATAEVLRLAADVQSRWHAETFVFYRDLKVDTPGLERLTRELRDAGIVFCRYGALHLDDSDAGVRIAYEEADLSVDLVVLPEAVLPPADAGALSRALDIRLGVDGFFQPINIRHVRSGVSSRRGVFLAGRCYLDCDLSDAVDDSLQAAGQVDALLASGQVEPAAVVAKVDPAKCIRCLTCVRTCPHAAAEIAEYPEQALGNAQFAGGRAAHVMETACWGCGACVANCPMQAIELLGQPVPTWMTAEGAAGGAA